MVETYINGNHSTLRRLYHELNKEARKDFIGFLLVALSAGDIRSFASEKGDSDSILAVLFPDGKAIGQPYTRNRTDIRMVRVFSEDEAYGIYPNFVNSV